MPERLVDERVRVLDGGQLSVADDPNPVADALHLVQNVRGEKDGAPLVADLAYDLQKLLLDQGVEPSGGLVEDEQRRAVEELSKVMNGNPRERILREAGQN